MLLFAIFGTTVMTGLIATQVVIALLDPKGALTLDVTAL